MMRIQKRVYPFFVNLGKKSVPGAQSQSQREREREREKRNWRDDEIV